MAARSDDDPGSRAGRARRGLALAGWAAAVAALHALLLAEWPARPAAGPRVQALVVRQIVVSAPDAGSVRDGGAPGSRAVSGAAADRSEPPGVAGRDVAARAARSRSTVSGSPGAAGGAAAPGSEPVAAAPRVGPSTARASGTAGALDSASTATKPGAGIAYSNASASASATATATDATNGTPNATNAANATAGPDTFAVAAEPVPLYPVLLPPATTLVWQRTRSGSGGGPAAGAAFVIEWQPDAAGYLLTLTDAAGDGWASRGAVGVHGIEPERLVERRRGRDVRAANFRRDVGRISFSGPAVEHPLLAGAQDRLSWLLQLAGVVAAAPERFAPGATVELFVAGTRGDAAPWRFEVEALDGPAGAVPAALRLAREPTQRWEPRVEVWLDPARGHLPVRWRTRAAESGETVDHRLVSASAEPDAGPRPASPPRP